MDDAVVMRVCLLKPRKHQTIQYTGQLLLHQPDYCLILARWHQPRLDLGYLCFEPGDRFYEHFYADRWYTIFDIRTADDQRKGWYCNVARPARITADLIESEDLELDLFVSADRQQLLRLDEAEFAACQFEQHEPTTYQQSLAALACLEQLARAGYGPFAPDVVVR